MRMKRGPFRLEALCPPQEGGGWETIDRGSRKGMIEVGHKEHGPTGRAVRVVREKDNRTEWSQADHATLIEHRVSTLLKEALGRVVDQAARSAIHQRTPGQPPGWPGIAELIEWTERVTANAERAGWTEGLEGRTAAIHAKNALRWFCHPEQGRLITDPYEGLDALIRWATRLLEHAGGTDLWDWGRSALAKAKREQSIIERQHQS